jgi:hypothetical protein
MEYKYFDEVNPKKEIYIIEGIDVDFKNKKVKVNFNHENGIDTSISNNPSKIIVNDIEVYSIFKRKKLEYDKADGNPLLHALKNNFGWVIDKYDKELLYKQFKYIISKIPQDYDTIIKVPSSNQLNNELLNLVKKYVKHDNIIEDTFNKLKTSDVIEKGIDFNSMTEYEYKLIMRDLKKMGEYFTFKNIKTDLRKYINDIYDDTDTEVLKYANIINGKKILVLDDSISSGQTLSIFMKNINFMFTPNKISCLTLFSKI